MCKLKANLMTNWTSWCSQEHAWGGWVGKWLNVIYVICNLDKYLKKQFSLSLYSKYVEELIYKVNKMRNVLMELWNQFGDEFKSQVTFHEKSQSHIFRKRNTCQRSENQRAGNRWACMSRNCFEIPALPEQNMSTEWQVISTKNVLSPGRNAISTLRKYH